MTPILRSFLQQAGKNRITPNFNQTPYNLIQKTCTFSGSAPNSLACKNVTSQNSSKTHFQGLAPILALSLYGLQRDDMEQSKINGKSEYLPLMGKNDLLIPFKAEKEPSFKEPTLQEMITEAEFFCEGRKKGTIDVILTHIPFLSNAIQYNFSLFFLKNI